MKFCLMSDVHIDRNNGNQILDTLSTLPPDCNTIVLAGDVSDDVMLTSKWLVELKKHCENLIFVPGNHDFYNVRLNRSKMVIKGKEITYNVDCPIVFNDGWALPRTVPEIQTHYKKWCDDFGIIMLNKSSVVIDGITFVGGTGWHDFVGGEPFSFSQQVQEWITDGRDPDYIIWDKNGSTADRVLLEAKLEFLAINEAVIAADNKVVVVTHHLPHRDLSWKKPGRDTWTKLHGMFVNSLMETIVSPKIKYWCYGHTHRRDMRDIHGITYICNPVGYPTENSPWRAIDFEV